MVIPISRYLAYESLGGSAGNYRPCNLEYLNEILENLATAEWTYFVDFTKVKDKMPVDLQETLRHCRRLFDAPGLFETRELEESFVDTARARISAIAAAVNAHKANDQSSSQRLEALDGIWNAKTRPFYKSNRKPWAQFLSNMLEGSEQSVDNPVAAVQLLPPAATELFWTWLKQHRETMAVVTSVRIMLIFVTAH